MPVQLLAAYATGIAMVHFVAPWHITGLSVITVLLLLAWVSLRRSPWTALPFLRMLLLAGFISANQALSPPCKSIISAFLQVLSRLLSRPGLFRPNEEALKDTSSSQTP